MCFISSRTKKVAKEFGAQLDAIHPRDSISYEALGNAIIGASDCQTSDVEPILVDGKLAYGVTKYGTEELVIVYDDDDYPDLKIPEYCNSELLTPGLRKAFALSHQFDSEIKRQLNKPIDETNEKKYVPKLSPSDIIVLSTYENRPLVKWILRRSFIARRQFQLYSPIFREWLFTLIMFAIGGVLFLGIQSGFNKDNLIAGLFSGAILGAFLTLFNGLLMKIDRYRARKTKNKTKTT